MESCRVPFLLMPGTSKLRAVSIPQRPRIQTQISTYVAALIKAGGATPCTIGETQDRVENSCHCRHGRSRTICRQAIAPHRLLVWEKSSGVPSWPTICIVSVS